MPKRARCKDRGCWFVASRAVKLEPQWDLSRSTLANRLAIGLETRKGNESVLRAGPSINDRRRLHLALGSLRYRPALPYAARVEFRAAICRITRLQPHLRQHGWPLVLPRRCGLISGCCTQYGSVVALPTNNLQADRESILGKSGGNAGGRLTGQVELIGEGDPLERTGFLALDRFRTLDALLERRARDRRRQQQLYCYLRLCRCGEATWRETWQLRC
jgi:hypothetical protein